MGWMICLLGADFLVNEVQHNGELAKKTMRYYSSFRKLHVNDLMRLFL